jgi:hypothetical protein
MLSKISQVHVVHAFGGFGALACVMVLGPRKGKYTENGIKPIPAIVSRLPQLEYSYSCLDGTDLMVDQYYRQNQVHWVYVLHNDTQVLVRCIRCDRSIMVSC